MPPETESLNADDPAEAGPPPFPQREGSSASVSKTCRRCGEEKPLEAFHRSRTGRHGRIARCKACESERRKEFRRKHPDRIRAQNRRADQKRSTARSRKPTKVNPPEVRERRRQAYQRWVEANPEKRQAQRLMYRAIRNGTLKRPTHCTNCGEPAEVQGHHDDYSKPLDVRWLCTKCHGRTHKVLRDLDKIREARCQATKDLEEAQAELQAANREVVAAASFARDKGYTVKEIAGELGISVSFLYQLAKRNA